MYTVFLLCKLHMRPVVDIAFPIAYYVVIKVKAKIYARIIWPSCFCCCVPSDLTYILQIFMLGDDGPQLDCKTSFGLSQDIDMMNVSGRIGG